MPRIDSEGSAVVVTDPKKPLNVELANEVGDPIDVVVTNEDPIAVSGSVTVANQESAPIPVSVVAGDIAIGDVAIASIAPGDNNIGNVDVVTMPPLPAGMNNIGDVDVVTLPELPAGANSIGSVFLDSFPHPNLGPFGDLEVMELTPVCHLSFASGIRSQLLTSAVANSATVDANGGRLRLQTGTNAAGSAKAHSARPVSYRPGQGIKARFTSTFTLGVAGSTQIAGMGNDVDGYFYGYNGADFGVLHRRAGVDTWVAQADWNGDVCDGNGASGFDLDPSKGVPLMVVYPFLGYGNIRFYVQNPATSLWILVHTIRYANTSADVQITNPSLNFYAHALNVGNTTNLTIHIGSVGVFIDGPRTFLGPQFATDNSKASITTETNLFTLRSAISINGVPNRGLIRVRQISAVTDANSGFATFRIRKNSTLGGSPAFTAISGSTADAGVTLTSAQSTASRDIAGTTVTGGDVIWNTILFNDSSGVIDLTSQDIWIAPGETLTVSGAATASAALAAAINWSEDVQ